MLTAIIITAVVCWISFEILGAFFSVFWEIAKIIGSFLLVPIIVICLILTGAFYIAFPFIIIFGIVALLKKAK